MNTSQLPFVLLCLLSGALIPVQASTNAAFSKAVGNPVITAVVVFATGLLAVAVYTLLARVPLPGMAELRSAPSYGYLGGLIVATYVIVITWVTPRLGVAPAIGLIITGQVIGAIAIDHFGWFDVAVRQINLSRIAGAGLMILGIYLVMGRK
jgi:bacterial/archaeal transporter family-2 protein